MIFQKISTKKKTSSNSIISISINLNDETNLLKKKQLRIGSILIEQMNKRHGLRWRSRTRRKKKTRFASNQRPRNIESRSKRGRQIDTTRSQKKNKKKQHKTKKTLAANIRCRSVRKKINFLFLFFLSTELVSTADDGAVIKFTGFYCADIINCFFKFIFTFFLVFTESLMVFAQICQYLLGFCC